MALTNNQQAFFALVRAGLWEQKVRLSQFVEIDFNEVYRMAEEQSVIGLVAAGLEHVVDVKVPQIEFLTFVGRAVQIEQQNSAMNDFIGVLVDKMRKAGISTLLVKGQGIAQCYERPLWRSCGDVDLLLNANNYEKTKAYCDSISDSFACETTKNIERLHQEYKFGDWIVELHGTMHAGLSRRMDRVIDQVQDETFSKKLVRIWKNGNTDVYLPCPDNDIIFVFSHILQHLFLEGIGLRQICDWCRLLWSYNDSIDIRLLEERIRAMGVVSEWKVFAAFAVKYLGMSADAMPLYSDDSSWKRKSDRICSFIMAVGNFGHNRDVEWSNPFKRRLMLIWHRITDTIRMSLVFPIDAPKFLMNYALDGIRRIV